MVFRLRTYQNAFEKTPEAQARRDELLRLGENHEAESKRVDLSIKQYLRHEMR